MTEELTDLFDPHSGEKQFDSKGVPKTVRQHLLLAVLDTGFVEDQAHPVSELANQRWLRHPVGIPEEVLGVVIRMRTEHRRYGGRQGNEDLRVGLGPVHLSEIVVISEQFPLQSCRIDAGEA